MDESTDPADREDFLTAEADSDRATAKAQAAALRFLARTILARDRTATELRIDEDPSNKDGEFFPRTVLVDGRPATYEFDILDGDIWRACRLLKEGDLLGRYARRDPIVRSAYLIDLKSARDATPDADPSTAERCPDSIHPAGCGCNDCGEGLSIPLNVARPEHIAAMLRGELRDLSMADLEITVVVRNRGENPPFTHTYEPAELGISIDTQR